MSYVSNELLSKIRRIQIQSVRLANDVLAGAYKSAFKGKGMEFEDVRAYIPGDDVRQIDWNVTARMQHPYIKNFREEREISVMLLVDVSASSRFGSSELTKSELIAEIGAVLAFSAIKNNDKIGLILFTDEIEKYIPPKKGTRHVLRVVRELLYFQPKHAGTNLSKALNYLRKVQPHAGICFLMSDFLCECDKNQLSLASLRHDLISILVSDPYEKAFPRVKALLQLQDLETGQQFLVYPDSEGNQHAYRAQAEAKIEDLRYLFKSIGADLIEIDTTHSYLSALKKFFKIRERRRR